MPIVEKEQQDAKFDAERKGWAEPITSEMRRLPP